LGRGPQAVAAVVAERLERASDERADRGIRRLVQRPVELEQGRRVVGEDVPAGRRGDGRDERVVSETRVGAVEGLDAGGDLPEETGGQRIDRVDLPARADRLEALASWQRRP
jgi:hypothetical protein